MGNIQKQNGNKKNHPTLSEEDINSLSDNITLERDQIMEWYKGYQREAPNGKMSLRRLIKFYRLLYPNGKVERFCKRLYNVLNMDKKDGINFVQLMTALTITESNDMTKRLSLANEYLFHSKEIINRKDLIKVIQSVNDLTIHEKDYKRQQDPKELVDLIMEKFDTNKNDYLTKDEFLNGCLNNPSIVELVLPQA